MPPTTNGPSRRSVLRTAAAGAAVLPFLAAFDAAAARRAGLDLGAPEPFDFEVLTRMARERAARPYAEPYRPAPDVTAAIDYDAHGRIRFRSHVAPFAEGSVGIYPVNFFHLGMFFQKSVQMHLVQGGQAREVRYAADYFDMPADSVARKLPPDSGFAGFRFQEAHTRPDWRTQDWLAFLGASYFRAIGDRGQYGLSARGIAVDVAAPTPEEFPDFVAFWIESAATPEEPCFVHALLDGPSLAGAYRFEIRRTEGVLMDVDARLFLRRKVDRFGIAPLTSMFWYGEHDRPYKVDWRPEVHDSDGLALWTGSGERIWRPLNNPRRVVASSFVDDNPRGFGLLQRDRDFENYLDGVNYDLRPSLWVEPLGSWGKGAVQLIEIPTDDEIHDNIVAFWVPAEPAAAGNAYDLRYRLHWFADEPYPGAVAKCVATRIGRGGEPGKPRPEGLSKFVVEFEGAALRDLPDGAKPVPVLTASRGALSYSFAEALPRTGRWRMQFDLAVDGDEPVELRGYIALDGRPLTETWLFQYHPRRA
ncbi:MAG: glucan biosynthesis protein [Alphaproteobacteria bacterium]